MGELQISVRQPKHIEPLVRWIHDDLPSEERQLKLKEASGQLARNPRLSPLEACRADSRIAGVYWLPLPGNVATLGGVRSVDQPTIALQLLDQSVRQAYQQGVTQIQAIVRIEDPHTPILLQAAGFEQLTNVSHLWLEMPPPHARREQAVPRQLDASWSWQPVQSMAQTEFARFIGRTFENTLDCPQLNGIRSETDVLTGFLDGRPFDRILDWQLLVQNQHPAGCVLLNQHSEQVVELAYMGLLPEFRGQRLGAALLKKAIGDTTRLRATILVAAVDEKNWPALRTYRDFGFERHRSLAVWLHPRQGEQSANQQT